MEEEVHLALKSRRRAEEGDDQHERLKAEEEARLVEELRLKSEEEDLRLGSEDEARLVVESRLKSE